jgi:hypothetical protein
LSAIRGWIGRRRTGIWLRGVCASVTVIEFRRRRKVDLNRALGGTFEFVVEAVTGWRTNQLHHCAKGG